MPDMGNAVRAVLFDLDDTLMDGTAAAEAGIDGLLARCPPPPPDRAAAVAAWDAAFRLTFPRYLSGELTHEESYATRMRAWADAMTVAIPAGAEMAWCEYYLAGYQAGWAAFADVAPCLGALGGFRLGVITNGYGGQQRAKLAALGLDGRFEVVIASGDAGFAKPDPRIFRLAASRLGVAPGDCLMVGDNPDTDVAGALGAGMRAVWLNRRADPAARDGVPELATLAGLPRLLGLSPPTPT
jgi:putative hydrolase of the HAD superfamily